MESFEKDNSSEDSNFSEMTVKQINRKESSNSKFATNICIVDNEEKGIQTNLPNSILNKFSSSVGSQNSKGSQKKKKRKISNSSLLKKMYLDDQFDDIEVNKNKQRNSFSGFSRPIILNQNIITNYNVNSDSKPRKSKEKRRSILKKSSLLESTETGVKRASSFTQFSKEKKRISFSQQDFKLRQPKYNSDVENQNSSDMSGQSNLNESNFSSKRKPRSYSDLKKQYLKSLSNLNTGDYYNSETIGIIKGYAGHHFINCKYFNKKRTG